MNNNKCNKGPLFHIIFPTQELWIQCKFWQKLQLNKSIDIIPKFLSVFVSSIGLEDVRNSSTTTSVQHLLGWCDDCHRTMAPVHSPHTSYRWRGERVMEPFKWMGIIRIWPGHRGYTPTLFEKCHGIFNDHRGPRPRFNISSERQFCY